MCTVVEGPPTEVQTFDDDELAHRLTDHDVEVIREIFKTPLTGSYNWDYEAANSKIRRLYELGKRFNWNSELDVDWTQAPPARTGTGRRSRRATPAIPSGSALTRRPEGGCSSAGPTPRRCRSSSTASRAP